MKKTTKSGFEILPSYLRDEIGKRIAVLQKVLTEAENKYTSFPEGKLHLLPGKTENSFRYYVRTNPADKTGEYLGKECGRLKETYALKRYYENLIKETTEELRILTKAYDCMSGDSIVEAYKKQSSGVKSLIKPLLTDDKSYIKNWESVTFEGLGFDPNDKTKFYSDKGERMRSKSEVFIANALLKNNIPYKYECPMLLDNGTVRYPDFTILCVRERKIKIWEHLGRMNDMDYVRRNVIKLEEYKSNGYVIGKDLLLSYEFSDNLLGNKEIEEIIKLI